ncbi:MAG: hypothetical protein KF802_15850 [Bdellovibrionaceae bacterium]|nr:hypothetical protein [Pseudobdellovibrionaceae bacterium]MBX3035216.1 hypothetical protein [Pseudobdellovibrionaceae bacterium]
MLKFPLLSLLSLSLLGCATGLFNSAGQDDSATGQSAVEISRTLKLRPGHLVIIQGVTSQNESFLNILVPRLKNYIYTVTDPDGQNVVVVKYESIQYAPVFYKVDKLRVKGLRPGPSYKLQVIDQSAKRRTLIDERSFSSLDLAKPRARFAVASGLSDEWRFDTVIDPMWARLAREKPDFVVLNGDVVHVDSHDFVERRRASEQDLWQRYIDTFQRVPFYHQSRLVPVLATWDDLDYGTNNADREFLAKDAARRVFNAFFGAPDLPGVYETGAGGTYAVFTGFNQRFLLMDNRSHRLPKSLKENEPFAHWGETQHRWLLAALASRPLPSWVFNGDQFFNGKDHTDKESFEGDHPKHFKRLMDDLKMLKTPVVFVSGDAQFSEVMKIPAERGPGFPTYELTSSSMHAKAREPWANPLRVPGAQTGEFNFLLVTSENFEGRLRADARALGLSGQDYFRVNLEVKR